MNPENRIVVNSKYETIKFLGKGGFGDVYLVEDMKSKKEYLLCLRDIKERKNKRCFKIGSL